MALRADLPELVDGALVLRSWSMDDAPALVRVMGETIANFVPVPWPYTPDDARAYLRGDVWPGDDHAAATWAITGPVGDDGGVLGSVGVHIVDPEAGVAEAGYWVAAEARGRGAGRVALGLVTEWAVVEWRLRRIDLVVAADNHASQAVARACGYTRSERTRAYPAPEAPPRSLWSQPHHVWSRELGR